MLGRIVNLSGRYHRQFVTGEVTSWNSQFILDRARERLAYRPRSLAQIYNGFNRTGEAFARRVGAALSAEQIHAGDKLFIYSTGALEALHVAKRLGMITILDQLDPAQLDERMVREERERWPDWERSGGEVVPECYYDRLRNEWQTADAIVVNSRWSANALLDSGIDSAKVSVIPLAYETESLPSDGIDFLNQSNPLKVLWLGQVILRKGIPYLVEAAARLPRIRFDIVGPIGISDRAVRSAPSNVYFHGKVSRERVIEFYRQSDLMVLPTLSDGFAITQLEAMAYGLPVITTAHCGDVVTDAIDGYVIPIRSSEALAAAVSRLDERRDLLSSMRHAARKKALSFSIDRYAGALTAVAENLARPLQQRNIHV